MLSAAAFSFHRSQYQQEGYTIFLNAACPALLKELAEIIVRAGEKDLIAGDESAHSWKELTTNPPRSLPDTIKRCKIAALLDGELDRTANWLNIYEPGEYIDAHVDAGGDAQLMIPIEIPPPGEGGDLWLGTEGRILPVAPGDVLLFAAHRLSHGTTPVQGGRRISFNARIWLREKCAA